MESMSNVAATTTAQRGAAPAWATSTLVDGMVHDGLYRRLRQRPHGHLRRGCAAAQRHLARGAGRLRARVDPARHRGPEGGPLRGRDRPGRDRGRGRARRPSSREDEGPTRRAPGARSRTLQAGLQEGRHGHRRQRLVHQRRRGRGGPHERRAGQARGPPGPGAAHRPGAARRASRLEFTIAPADAIRHDAREGRASSRATSTSGRSTRPSRWSSLANNQLLGLDRQQGERARRRGGARPPHRRQRRAHPGDAAPRPEGPRQAARPRDALHRRRRGAWPSSSSARSGGREQGLRVGRRGGRRRPATARR